MKELRGFQVFIDARLLFLKEPVLLGDLGGALRDALFQHQVMGLQGSIRFKLLSTHRRKQ